MSEQENSLNNRKGNLRGVEVYQYIKDKDDWIETRAVGWKVGDAFFIGVTEVFDKSGYDTEITISKNALRRMLAALEG